MGRKADYKFKRGGGQSWLHWEGDTSEELREEGLSHVTITGKRISGRGTAQHGVTPAVETVRRPAGLGWREREKEARGVRPGRTVAFHLLERGLARGREHGERG